MWLVAPNRIGIAGWKSADSVWSFGNIDANRNAVGFDVGTQPLRLEPTSDDGFPVLREQFVRGDELHLSFPQNEDSVQYGFRLAVRPVHFDGFDSGAERAIFELLVSVQTTLLDSHPTIDLFLPGEGPGKTHPGGDVDARFYHASNASYSAGILLGPHDAPFTSEIASNAGLRLRLFGEFLEKGVIRRARPWLILDRSGTPIDDDFVKSAWECLSESPLPLK